MIDNKIVYSGKGGVYIYVNENGEFFLQKENYLENIRFKTSLLRLLTQFELSVDSIHEGIVSEDYSIEHIFPFDDLMFFLIQDMKSSYWLNLVCVFLLNDQVKFKLNVDTLSRLKTKEFIYWLPQKETHLMWKLMSKMSRL
ncbi:hypothetical protein [Chitinophaga nivalis]|uniref:Uncharacterized protein n=1 Tax=Chitinophaga nivalis TaxID=2991709 RepID=A0ABT3IRL5_9BACT|nr:hypothetical protein [Chitinophaga nivalis]MCW3463683.1 hypothetical protein [Chitinophaga nivalis]MCW3486627.1 hypothetical protein [Chitinophaga nivalis]